MLKILNFKKELVGHIWKYKDLKKESELSSGDKTLSFTYMQDISLEEEFYIQDNEDEYVIKEINTSSDGYPQVVAKLNLEELEGTPWEKYQVQEVTIAEAARLALTGTGWVVDVCEVTKKRSAGILNADVLTIIDKLCTAFMCERVYDTKQKTVSFYEKIGNDKGVCFLKGLNLKKLDRKSDTYDYYTRIKPVGKDGLTIKDVNNGKDYLENCQYTDKIKTYLWIDESYEDATNLMEDAEKKLEELSKPIRSYAAEVFDLAKTNNKYDILDYKLGDTITLIDSKNKIRDIQRIVKMTEYPQEPTKNTCELANAVLSFEELQQKLKEATDIINTVVTSDGQFTGTVDIDDILHFEDGLANSSTIGSVKNSFMIVSNEIVAVKGTIGEIETNYLKAEDAVLKYAAIEDLDVVNQTVHTLKGDYADFKIMTTEELVAERAKVESLEADMIFAKETITKKLDAEDADIKFANIDFSNIGKAAIEQFFATSGLIKDVVVGDQTITGELVGVTIKGDLIEGGTVKADKLVIKGEDGLFYKLNVDALGETTASSDDKYQNGLDGSVIIAKSITATKIDVKDLVAFEATIGGFKISDSAIYSGVKESPDNTTRGTYLDKDGQVAIGDSDNYIKYLKDTDGNYHLLVSASEITLGTGKTVEETIDDIQIGAKNLIRNSNNLIYPDYGFADPSLVVTDDGAGNVDVQSDVVDFGDDGNGGVILTSELYDISDDGAGTATIDKKDGESAQKSPEMSTLTMGGKTYEVVDKYARNEIEKLSNLPTRYTKLPDDGVLAVDGMYFLGEFTNLTFGLPDAKNGDMIYITFSSGSRATALSISTTNHTGLEHLSIKDNASYELIGLYNTDKWVFVTNEV